MVVVGLLQGRMKFNPEKSKSISLSKRNGALAPILLMDGIRIENVSNVKHLGHILIGDLLDSKDIVSQTAVCNRKANPLCRISNT